MTKEKWGCPECDFSVFLDPGEAIKCRSLKSGPCGFKRIIEQSVVEQITTKRGSVYGPFFNNAIVAQRIKDATRSAPGLLWDHLPVDVREALDLIALKISRIVTGDPEYLDNWDDIGGYAKIVADRIRNKGVTNAE